jgi:hypothetical protein
MRFSRLIALVAVSVPALSCSSSLEPRDDVTLLVTNSSCIPGPCTSLRVFAFPSPQPGNPGGWRIDLGTMSGPTLCVRVPANSVMRIIGQNAHGGADTTALFWTTAQPAQLGVEVAVTASATTPTFVPASAAGWSVSLPGNDAATPASPCSPALPPPAP